MGMLSLLSLVVLRVILVYYYYYYYTTITYITYIHTHRPQGRGEVSRRAYEEYGRFITKSLESKKKALFLSLHHHLPIAQAPDFQCGGLRPYQVLLVVIQVVVLVLAVIIVQ